MCRAVTVTHLVAHSVDHLGPQINRDSCSAIEMGLQIFFLAPKKKKQPLPTK